MPKIRRVDGKLVEEPLHHESVQATESDWMPPVCLPDVPDIRPSGITGHGEFAGVRDSMGKQFAQTITHTDGSDAAREWVESKVNKAAAAWDRGVRNGSIKRH